MMQKNDDFHAMVDQDGRELRRALAFLRLPAEQRGAWLAREWALVRNIGALARLPETDASAPAARVRYFRTIEEKNEIEEAEALDRACFCTLARGLA